MPIDSDANIATADALTMLLHNQHGIAASLEELAKWVAREGGQFAVANILAPLEVLDENAQALTDAINTVRGG